MIASHFALALVFWLSWVRGALPYACIHAYVHTSSAPVFGSKIAKMTTEKNRGKQWDEANRDFQEKDRISSLAISPRANYGPMTCLRSRVNGGGSSLAVWEGQSRQSVLRLRVKQAAIITLCLLNVD